jgi:FtsP/CotA-like multicopper oxidase with cupredoxin domain
MLSRRAFVLSAVAASTASTLARSQTASQPSSGGSSAPTLLRLERRSIEVNGKPASVFGIRQPDGTFGIRTQVGTPFRVRVQNNIDEPSLIHWHGLTPPWQQDGVPGVSGPPIPPGGSADYDFPLRFGGTFWMHSHQGLQEQLLMAAPLIIRDQPDRPDQQEVVVTLADFSFTPPEHIFAELKKGSNMSSMAGSSPPAPASTGLKGMGTMAPGMTMDAGKPDLNDVMGGYRWSLNNVVWNKDVPPLPVAEGERVELIFINQTRMPHPMHLHGHEFQVVEIDGKRFPGAVRDTVLVPPGRRVVVAFNANNPGLWALHCHLLYHLEAGMFTTLRYV